MKKLIFSILLLLMAFIVHAQMIDTIPMLINNYIIFNRCNPYPEINDVAVNQINRSKFLNVMDFGAKGDGSTADEAAIVSCIKACPAGSGIIFPPGRTYAIGKPSVLTMAKSIYIYAVGATIKLKDLTDYSFLQFNYVLSNNNYAPFFCIWIGGTLDGNQTFQRYPSNPRGGIYDGAFEEDHGQMIRIGNVALAMFYGVKGINTVTDVINCYNSRVSIIARSHAKDGAAFKFLATGSQGTYFKLRQTQDVLHFGKKTMYAIYDTTEGASMGIQVSSPEVDRGAIMDTNTVCVINHCRGINELQSPIHFEDCARIVINDYYNIQLLDSHFPRLHMSNELILAVFNKCDIHNGDMSFAQAQNLRLGFVTNCVFDQINYGGSDQNQFFIENATHINNCSFNGPPPGGQAWSKYVLNSTFKNFPNVAAVKGVIVAGNSNFTNGNVALNLKTGGKAYLCTYTNVTSHPVNSTVVKGWDDDFNDKIVLKGVDAVTGAKTFLFDVVVR